MQSIVNVSDFGAIGQTLTTTGNIVAGSPDLTVTTISGWVVGAGVEVDAGAGDVFRARVTAVTGNVLGLSAAPGFSATSATVTNDDSVPIQAAYDAVRATGGTICIPPGRYRCADTLNLDDNLHRVRFEGAADRNFPGNSLEFTRATGHLVTLHSAHDVNFRQIKFAYANPAYADDLVDLDWSSAKSDPAYVDFDDCIFTGTASAKNARSLLRLNRAIICSVKRCGFLYSIASYGVNAGNGGVTFDPANMITMEYSSWLPVDQPTAALLSLDGATRDYLDVAAFTNGILGIMPRSDIANSEVVLFAGRDPTSKRLITVARLGVSDGRPYMKGPIFAMATYTTATRPPANHVAAGSAIFNTDSKKLNMSDGTGWFDANGNPV